MVAAQVETERERGGRGREGEKFTLLKLYINGPILFRARDFIFHHLRNTSISNADKFILMQSVGSIIASPNVNIYAMPFLCLKRIICCNILYL
jgi:hypothetical protein